MLAGGVAQAADDAAAAGNGADGGIILQEVTVTATRRAEEITKVPLNVTAYTPGADGRSGRRQIDDLARLTPDLQFTHTSGAAGNNSSDIAIRGVFSDVGAATTGDLCRRHADPDAQRRLLERQCLSADLRSRAGRGACAVRRAPCSAPEPKGGAVRFITPEPGLQKYSGYVRSELAETLSGDPCYETGAAIGGPIIEDKLGFRVSAWGRNDGGYIDRVSPDTGQTVDSKSQLPGVVRRQSGPGRGAAGRT